jgi:hypothetical protein
MTFHPLFILIPAVETKLAETDAFLRLTDPTVSDVAIADHLNQLTELITGDPVPTPVNRVDLLELLSKPFNITTTGAKSFYSNISKVLNDSDATLADAAIHVHGVCTSGPDVIDFSLDNRTQIAVVVLNMLITKSDPNNPERKFMDETTKEIILGMAFQPSNTLVSWVQKWNLDNPENPIRHPQTGEVVEVIDGLTVSVYKGAVLGD